MKKFELFDEVIIRDAGETHDSDSETAWKFSLPFWVKNFIPPERAKAKVIHIALGNIIIVRLTKEEVCNHSMTPGRWFSETGYAYFLSTKNDFVDVIIEAQGLEKIKVFMEDELFDI